MNKYDNWLLFSALVCAAVLGIAFFGSKAVTVMAENTVPERDVTIIIDAGHGGEDGGAVSLSGIPESRYNLSVALRLEKLLQLLGMDTIMVRTTDISVYTEGQTLAQKKRSDLKARAQIVRDTENGLLLSIHQNVFPDGQYHGAQVFYADTPGSKDLAESLQTALAQNLNKENHRNAKKAQGIYLMEHIQRPGVLIECGFLSNPQEEAMLRDPEYQKKLCCVIAAALKDCLPSIRNPNT